ncbi:hypothetical protein TTHERM_01354240 (macronuclear) [Tetrahymena thermophila SB210]|uniref:Uncharacterized protein n=1 Tax=Tetrahymena thermophila (strain SB210) TaxID=312017 RepID=Q24CQ4_TETTS|nr:hypothetical protein TTHERM_01354240 [Tetrahymena thermophila SB210]EAS05555.1 hypothetical protein TTHERM_01354240 [Tetrahymena thermophila SB210]|eukprot:XP_001025800.1 hypothetical protein TTHERM_01354240 [Tetrahymena thermophila SB210]
MSKQITFMLKEQQISNYKIQSLSLIVSKLKKLLKVQLSFKDKSLFVDESYITCAQKGQVQKTVWLAGYLVLCGQKQILNKFKLIDSLIQYDTIESSFNSDVQIAVENTSQLIIQNGIVLLASSLVSLNRIEKNKDIQAKQQLAKLLIFILSLKELN